MQNEELIKQIIREHVEQREYFRQRIRELENEEFKSFKRMLDQLHFVGNCADPAEIYREFETSLE